jgi:hypothetical protein
MVLDILKQTESYPKIQFLPYYIEHFGVLFKDVEEVKKTFFDCDELNGCHLAFLPLYAMIFNRFGGQVSGFLYQKKFRELTWMVVEFFSNLPNDRETEIHHGVMEIVKMHRKDIWSWINRQFDMVVREHSYVLTHRHK